MIGGFDKGLKDNIVEIPKAVFGLLFYPVFANEIGVQWQWEKILDTVAFYFTGRND